jgi:hypothetical protein
VPAGLWRSVRPWRGDWAIDWTSRPEQKDLPAPLIITARIEVSAAKDVAVFAISVNNSKERALCLDGLLRVTTLMSGLAGERDETRRTGSEAATAEEEKLVVRRTAARDDRVTNENMVWGDD